MPEGLKGTVRFFSAAIMFLLAGDLFAIQRFPKPEFETGYVYPETLLPSPRAEILAAMDVVVLVLALSVVTWLVLRKRSRKGVFWTSMFSLAYFGFYREGCVCSVGSIQNVTLALFDHSYVLPLTVIAFFILPLIFTLFFGRTFCAGVCPFGSFQDLVAFRPQPLSTRLNAALGLLPYAYLGLAVLYAATASDFIICRYDPFVGVFRFNASFGMFIFAALLLIAGIFIARPYCRFLCPYGVLLNWISRFSWRHMTITPAECIQCRLCEHSCPYDAIAIPVVSKSPDSRSARVKKLMLVTLLIPFLAVAGGWTVSAIHETLAGVNAKVGLAKELLKADDVSDKNASYELKAFRASGKPLAEVYREARQKLDDFYTGSWILGGFMGLVTGIMIAGRLLGRQQKDYVPDKGTCFSCGRCMDFCPVKEGEQAKGWMS